MFNTNKLLLIWQQLTQHKVLFYVGLVIKVVLGVLLASNYMVQLFVPFMQYTVSNGFSQSYNYYYTIGNEAIFPYPLLMQVVLSVPLFLIQLVSNGKLSIFTCIIGIRLVLLLADITILYVLLQWLKSYSKQVLLIYWLSPLLIYITYVHGQLDVLPIALLMVSLYYLGKHKVITAFVILACAIGCKTSVVLALPFILIYSTRVFAKQIKKLLLAMLLLVIVLFIVNIPAFYTTGYRYMVYANAEQARLLDSYIAIGLHYKFYIIPALYLGLVLHFVSYWQMSRVLLLMYIGFSFGIITVFIAPNQGWYYWCMPFFMYFFVKAYRNALPIFIAVNVCYFLYFGITATSDYCAVWQMLLPQYKYYNIYHYLSNRNINVTTVVSLVSTLLQTVVIAYCYYMYRYGISQIKHHKMLYQPYLIGIAGDSASGKTTLANSLYNLFGTTNATVINGDDMHKWERGDANWKNYTHLNPLANNLHHNVVHLLQALKGKSFLRQHYNHDTGKFMPAKQIKANKIVLVEGLHSFYLQQQKELLDLKIYLQPQEETRVNWKIERDVKERGHDTATVLQSISSRVADANKYIQVQANDADIIICYSSNKEDTQLQITCSNQYNIQELVTQLQATKISAAHTYYNNTQTVTIKGTIPVQAIATVADVYTNQLEELGFGQVKWQAAMEGVIQLCIWHIINYKFQLSHHNLYE